tara:strand:- start:71 stop:388 length:318 start_codon:yes stop_codon:yes gene_type:complete
MKRVAIIAALVLGSQAFAQEAPKSILDFIPQGVEYELEKLPWGDTSVYTYDVSVLNSMEGLVFVNHRKNEMVDALVYKVGEFVVRHIRPDEDDEIQDPFIHIYRH